MSVESELKSKIQKALAERLFKQNPSPKVHSSYRSYVEKPQDVLVEGVELSTIRPDFDKGAGGELKPNKKSPPKFHAAHSSSALAANTFGIYKTDSKRLTVCGRSGFTNLQFEFQCPTGAGRGIANLDVLLQGNNIFLGVESKLIEPLTKKMADFSDKYHSVIESVADPSWRSVYNILKKQQDNYTHLDAAQLVKHYLGLRQTPNEKSVILVYLYWEPMNAKDISIYQKHTEEIKDLKERLSGADTPLLSISYPELWREMEASNPDHVARLRARYEFEVDNTRTR